ncbi:heavy-metal-associated domain-containing protein [Arthrobacter sp. CAU 1506]|uniref:heavy-metal-associated domain-containing protein n=1 Tax=Arthrobacter sp. CAU 1506 TaxID=2560052 RepID=UPI0010AD263F|nr:heavy-metal-associated domain-containing protein [Arthrobacter sp. CAU 1506]TJY68969.1 heavy-metal-associated domain-containing protein [Arthrobacter sp. CAU 1506]
MSTTTISIDGMTCGHCVDAVTEELKALEGVQTVSIQLNKGGISTATVSSEGQLDPAQVGEAVAEAGYTVVANIA